MVDHSLPTLVQKNILSEINRIDASLAYNYEITKIPHLVIE